MVERPKWVPTWEGPLEGWTVNYASQNLWRVHPHHDIDDLYQTGFLIFLNCCKKYGKLPDEGHFMALYKRSFVNYVHDISKTRSGETGFKEFNTTERAKLENQLPKELQDIDEELFSVRTVEKLIKLLEDFVKVKWLKLRRQKRFQLAH